MTLINLIGITRPNYKQRQVAQQSSIVTTSLISQIRRYFKINELLKVGQNSHAKLQAVQLVLATSKIYINE